MARRRDSISPRTGSEWRIYRKDYLISEDGTTATTLVKSLWTENTINNDYGKKAIKELFGANVMSFPKPPELIKRMASIGSHQDSIVLDFFYGSATTAHAVMQLFDLTGVKIKVFGMVKDSKHRTRAITSDDGEIMLSGEAFRLVTEIQDEVHRFAISYHRKKRTQKMLKG